jgi:predicted RNase H-like HicB family nuclease
MATSTVRMTVVYEEGDDGWIIASIPEVPGTHSQGRTKDEARANVIDALETILTPDDDLTGDTEPLVLTVQR